jgi:multidrug resistance protein
LKKNPLVPIALIVAVDVLALTIIIPLLPIYAEKMGASAFQAGLLISVYGVCQLIAGPILGQWSDRIGRKPVLLVSQIGTFAGLLVLALARSLPLVFLARVIDGLTAGNLSVAQAYIADVTEPQNRAKAFGIIGIAFGFGFLVGPGLSGILARYGYQVPILFAALLSLASVISTATLLPGRMIHDAPPPTSARKMPIRILLESLTKPGLSPLLWQFLMFVFTFSLFMSGFPLFAERRFTVHGQPMDVQHIGYIFAFMGFVGMIIQGGLVGRLVKAFGEPKLIVVGFACMIAASIALAHIETIPALLVTIVCLGFGTAVVRPALTSRVTQSVARNEAGGAIGLTQGLMSFSQITAPALGGALIQHSHLAGWALTGGLVSLVGFGLASRASARG